MSAASSRGRISAKCVLVAAAALLAADVIAAVVSGDTASLLQAVADAQPGETVLVPEGTYELTAQLEVTKAITLKASGTVAKTILKRVGTSTATSGRLAERVLYVNHADATVSGFTVTGGRICGYDSGTDDVNGAGVLIDTAGGMLTNCVVSGNTGGGNGGNAAGIGVAAYGGTLANCTIANNSKFASGAGTISTPGIYASDVTIVDCIITNNTADSGNAYTYGGGVRCSKNVTINRCIITHNVQRGSPYGVTGGGGIYVGGSGCTIANTLVAHNKTTQGQGGGILANASCSIVNCTIVDNESKAKKSDGSVSAGGLYACNSNVKVYNTIISGNESKGSGSGEPEWNAGSAVTFVNCLSPKSREGITEGTPTFDTTVGEYFPASTSTSVDAGSNDPVTGTFAAYMTEGDLARATRIANSLVDIGAYEYQPPLYKADVVMTGAKQIMGEPVTLKAVISTTQEGAQTVRWRIDSGEWSVSSSSLEKVVTFAASGNHDVELEVSIGGVVQSPVTTASVYIAPAAITVGEGGYSDIASAVAAARGGSVITVEPGVWPVTAEVLLDAAIVLKSSGGASVTEIVRTDKTSEWEGRIFERVLHLTDAGARVEGLTISGGRIQVTKDGDGLASGAGALVEAGTLVGCTITNCTLHASGEGSASGAGLSLYGSSAVASNCLVRANTSPSVNVSGVGVYVNNGGLLVASEVSSNIRIEGGTSVQNGGGICCADGRVSRCVISNNVMCATDYYGNGGGGVAITGAGVVDNCLIVSNAVLAGCGGGVTIRDGRGKVLNCTIIGNYQRNAPNRDYPEFTAGGCHYGWGKVANCIFADNYYRESELNVTGYVAGVSGTLCATDDGLPTNANNLVAAPLLRPPLYRPTASTPGRSLGRVGDYAAYIGKGTPDLFGVSRRRDTKIDPGCGVYPQLGLSVLVR